MFKTVRFATEANRPVFAVDPWNLSGSPFDRINPKLLTIWTATVKLIRAKTIFMMNCVVWVNGNQTKMIIIPKLCRFYSRKYILFSDVTRLLTLNLIRFSDTQPFYKETACQIFLKKLFRVIRWQNFKGFDHQKPWKRILNILRKVFSLISRQC